ncbi:hypothetical protein K469DRAFT_692374 [Zopfia rhizophila CBS 207.26]|uniref:Uncharacterized protein n=1 Tax=Zopfia rhizophila CBS 207.26 TaxID=1314779 RepID=A0A6A6DNS4_9PEZI|nr:hypothetical protein K469DRAFT_692374 [Zopfia rhizophila CBS 207.26]
MTDSKMDEVKDDRKLKGKTNFITNDILEYLTGEEVVPSKPKKEDYFVKLAEVTCRSIRTKKTAQTFTPSTDDDDEADDAQTMMSTNNALRWQIDYNEHKNAKDKMKLASKLLNAWVSNGIKIKIKDCTDAKEAYDFIKK